ncbi:MAG TPA: YncE family protein [Terriglobales bacterium]|nr:YncE family protein [Terriglobales bacterium]
MRKHLSICVVVLLFIASVFASAAENESSLQLVGKIPLPALREGDFDHFAKDIEGHRLFLTGEANGTVEVFDSISNKHTHTITGLKSPHALLYRKDTNRLFVVDGDASRIRIYDATTFRLVGQIMLAIDADSMAYDADTKYLYVVNGGRAAKTPYSLISVIDTDASKKLRDIKIDTNWVEALALEKSGPRLFCVLTSQNAIGVMDRTGNSLTATWSLPEGSKHPVSLGLDEQNHRLFIATREPGQLIVLNSDNGKVVSKVATVGMIDDLSFDPKQKRIYLAGDGSIEIYSQKTPDDYSLLGKVPGGFRAKTGLLVPEWNRYYLAVPRHQAHHAEVRVYKVGP